MGLFSHIKKIVSGDIYRSNTLIGGVKKKIAERVEDQVSQPAIKNFLLTALDTSFGILVDLFFETVILSDMKYQIKNDSVPINELKVHRDRLTEDRVLQAYKILFLFFVTMFLANKDNIAVFSELSGIPQDKLYIEITFKYLHGLFNFDGQDKFLAIVLYQVLDKKKSRHIFFVELYKNFLDRVLDVKFKNLVGLEFFILIICIYYQDIFLGVLRSRLKIDKKNIFKDEKLKF